MLISPFGSSCIAQFLQFLPFLFTKEFRHFRSHCRASGFERRKRTAEVWFDDSWRRTDST